MQLCRSKGSRNAVVFTECCFSPFHPSAEPSHLFSSMKSPKIFPRSASYQFQPCLLDGEYLSIKAVSLSRESFCSRRNWETDWFSTPGLVGREGRLCSLDQCSCWLTLLETRQWEQISTHIHTNTHISVPVFNTRNGNQLSPGVAGIHIVEEILLITGNIKWWLLSQFLQQSPLFGETGQPDKKLYVTTCYGYSDTAIKQIHEMHA